MSELQTSNVIKLLGAELQRNLSLAVWRHAGDEAEISEALTFIDII
jgi:hypothetical protein